jgi:hypothetical protein
LDYSFFPQLNTGDKIWRTLYELRSRIAHGGKVDFADNKLKHLKDMHAAVTFLYTSAKALLRLALKEPELIQDLQHC